MSLENLLKKIPYSVQWHDGMLLSSQHFQTFDHYHNSLCTLIGRCANSFDYGILKLKIDESALVSGTIIINEILGILDDGTILNYNSEYENYKLEYNISEHIKNINKTKIYLCVLKHTHGNNNFEQNLPRYFSILNEDIKDENTGENPINIPSKKPKFLLMSESELSDKFSYLPLIEITKKDNILSKTDFIPPYIKLTNECPLYELLSSIVKSSKQKIGYILSKKNLAKDNYIIDSALRILVAYSITIESLLNTQLISPFEIYKVTLEFAAQLLGFSVSNIVPILPSYNHLDSMNCFKKLEEHIDKSLNQIIEFSSAIPFILEENIFKLKLIKDWDSKKELIIGIKRSDKSTQDEFITWVNGAQIVSESMIDDIKQKRVLGANRNMVSSSDLGFENIQENLIVLKITTDSHYIKFGENLCIFNSSFTILPDEIVFFQKEST